MQTEQKTLLVVWTMDDFELTGYPSQDSHLVNPLVLSIHPPFLKLVWQNRVINHGIDDSEFPEWEEIDHTQIHLGEAWKLLVR